jgi:hypothetical protein
MTFDTRERQLRQWQLWRLSTGKRKRIYWTHLEYPQWLRNVILCQHGCLYFGTQSTEEWLDCSVIHEVCIQMNLQQTGCTLPPFAQNKGWITRDAYSEDIEELRFWIQVCQHMMELTRTRLDEESKIPEMSVSRQLDKSPKTRSCTESRLTKD